MGLGAQRTAPNVAQEDLKRGPEGSKEGVVVVDVLVVVVAVLVVVVVVVAVWLLASTASESEMTL
eukprot:5510154-Pyramimonas_sp.AAC.1